MANAKKTETEAKIAPVVAPKGFTKTDVQELLDTIARKSVETNTAYMHSMLLLNTLLREPNADQLFDDSLKAQARDLWLKVKSTGLQLNDPPFLFGLPEKIDGEAKA